MTCLNTQVFRIHSNNKKVPMRETARCVLPPAKPVPGAGGGVPQSWPGGYPSLGWRGTPVLALGLPQSWGVPGRTCDRIGVPPSRTCDRTGIPSQKGHGTRDWGTPWNGHGTIEWVPSRKDPRSESGEGTGVPPPVD